MSYWKDKGARRTWRWILLVYSLIAFALALYGAFTFLSDLILAGIFLASTVLLIRNSHFESKAVWTVIVLFLLPALPYGVAYGCHSIDAIAARSRSEFRVLGVPLILIRDGALTPYFREYISDDLPNPIWYPCFKGQIGFGAAHTDYFTQGISTADDMLGSVLKYYDPPDGTKKAIVKDYFTLLHQQSENNTALAPALASRYATAVERLFMQNAEVQPGDLPSVEDIRRQFTSDS